MAKLSQKEIGQLKQQLGEKMDEYRAIYSKMVEKGEVELPEDVLSTVSGGVIPIFPTQPPSDGGGKGGGPKR